MEVLPPAFAAMGAYRQFVLWIPIPSTTRPGKTDKITINPHTGTIADAHDTAIHLTAQEAIGIAPRWQAGVGFTFTDRDPFFFLDIDNCLVNGQWTDTATNL